jgi:putative phosphoesterase
MSTRGTLIGVISDTHGLWRSQVANAFDGVDLVLHAGDVGEPGILAELRALAPVIAVRGNVDKGAWARRLPKTEVVTIGTAQLYVLHNLEQLDLDPAAAGFAAVISGHSHQPMSREQEGVLYLNPGSAGPRRFTLPVSVARMRVKGKRVTAELIELDV